MVRGIVATLERCAQPADTPLLTAKYEPDFTLGGVLHAKL